jgi:hypothetical protein
VIASRTIPGNPRFSRSLGNRLKWTSPDDDGKHLANRGFDPLTVHDPVSVLLVFLGRYAAFAFRA